MDLSHRWYDGNSCVWEFWTSGLHSHLCSFPVHGYEMVTPSLVFFPFLPLMCPIPLFLSWVVSELEKKKNKPQRTKYPSVNIAWFLAEAWGRHCSKITSAEAKHCWGSTASDGFARKLSSSPLLGRQPARHTPCLSERVGGSVPRDVPAALLATCMQQYAGTFSSFSYSFWWNMQKFVCLRPLAFCQIGWNCSTGSKCAWGKIANWQMARKHNHICLISWRTRLKIHHYNRLQEGRQRVTGKQ